MIRLTLTLAVAVSAVGIAFAETTQPSGAVFASSASAPSAAPTVDGHRQDDRRQLSIGSMRFDPRDPAQTYRSASRAPNGKALRLVQFQDTPKQEWRDSLQSSGLQIIQYYPHNAYLVWGSDSAASTTDSFSFVRWHGTLSPDWKLSPDLKGRLGMIDNVQVLVFNDGNLSNTLAQIEGVGGQVLNVFDAQPDKALKAVILRIDAGLLSFVNQLPQVVWSEYVGPRPILDDELSAQIVAGNYNASNLVTAPGYIASIAGLGLTGNGVRWAITDTGIDYDNPELGPRIVDGHDFAGCTSPAGRPGDDKSTGGHGTHVAGIIGGAGVVAGGTDANGFHYGIGMAPQVQFVALNPICGGAGASWPPAGGWQENSKQAILRDAVGTNNSWTSGEGTNVGYNATARTHDFMVRDGNFDTPTVNDQFMIVFSAGNSGPGASSLTAPKEAKSPIVVAATRNQRAGSINDLAGFSSRGPAVDGRFLPTIGAPGETIASTRRVAGASSCGTAIGAAPLNNYSFCSGTSMAAPHVAGTAALLTQWWRDNNGGATPSPAMIKALLVNSAVDMTGPAPVPNNDEGWGRIQLRNAIGEGLMTVRNDQADVLDTVGQVYERSYGVPDGGKPVRITLAWTDAPGAAGANPALVNNLDLEVIAGGQTYRGNVFSAGQSATGGSSDNRNPVENVFLPAGVGAVTVRVIATTLPGDGVPNVGDATDQDFALVCSNCVSEPGFTVSMSTSAASLCAGTTVERAISVGQVLGFSDPVTMSSTGLPNPGTVGFSPNPVNPPGISTMTVDTTGVAAGSYTITANGNSGAIDRSASFELFLATAAATASTLATPGSSATNVPANVEFSWTASAQAFDYLVEVATDAGFANIVASTVTQQTSWTPPQPLDTSTQYFWRVHARNACGGDVLFAHGFEDGSGIGGGGSGAVSATFSFTTEAAPGDCPIGPVPTIVLSEDFEGAATGWVQQAGGVGTNTWAITSNFPFAGTKALQGVPASTGSDQRFVSPAGIVLPSVGNGLTLSFQSYQVMEDRTGGCWDGGFIEVAVGGGAFTQITAGLLTDPYDGPLSGADNPAAGLPAWCGDPQPYLKSVIDLAPYAGQTVQFRFRATSDGSVNRPEGWNIDNVEIKRCN